jgi:environmental stress-induced protein Ves
MSIVRFERDQLASTAWKNGGGRTREIVRMPAGSTMDTFDWRASIADITADGPFSTFAGFDRVIVLLSGDGVHLRSSDGTIDHRLDEPLVPFAFAGERAIEASLIGGTSSDFNIMTRRATMHGDVRVAVGNETLAAGSAGLLFAARGTWGVRTMGGAPASFSLPSNCGLWWDGESLGWEVAPRTAGDALIAVHVTP